MFAANANPLNHIMVWLPNPPVDAECCGDGGPNGRKEIQD
jgi:hypothetical protein